MEIAVAVPRSRSKPVVTSHRSWSLSTAEWFGAVAFLFGNFAIGAFVLFGLPFGLTAIVLAYLAQWQRRPGEPIPRIAHWAVNLGSIGIALQMVLAAIVIAVGVG